MTTRNTSRDAYDHLVKTGQLVGKQARVMEHLIVSGSATSGEVLDRMGIKNVNAWRSRFTELSARGLIVEQGTRRCTVSSRTCVVWAPTARSVPLSPKGAKSVSAAAWRKLADALAKELDGHGGTARDSAAMRSYRAVTGGGP